MRLWCLEMSPSLTSTLNANSKFKNVFLFCQKYTPETHALETFLYVKFLLLLSLDLELKDHEGSTALWLALQYITVASDPSVNPFEDEAPVVNGTSFDENSFAARLIQRGSNPDAPDSKGTIQILVKRKRI